MNARYILLLQRQFDEQLSERETYELQGFLAGNESAARLSENVRHLIDEYEQVELPEHLKPQDEELLLIEIITKLRKGTSKNKSSGWLDALSKLLPCKMTSSKTSSSKTSSNKTDSNRTDSQHQSDKQKKKQGAKDSSDELAILRSKRKESRASERDTTTNSNAIDSMRSKLAPAPNSVADDSSAQTSLAQAIKNKLQQTKNVISNPQENWDAPPQPVSKEPLSGNWDWLPDTTEQTFTDSVPPQQTTQATESNETVSELRSADSTKSADPHHSQTPLIPAPELTPSRTPAPALEPVPPPTLQSFPLLDFSANHQILPFEQKQKIMPLEQKPNQPFKLTPARAIPVNDIIAHMSELFSDKEPIQPPEVDPLGATSGVYPQIREEDLRAAKSARLGTTPDTIEHGGQIKSIGKFLLDKNSEAAIGSLNDGNAELSHARILSDEEARALHDCLTPIQSQEGVAGCVIVGYDGMIITSTLPPEVDKDAFSAWALFTYMNTHELVKVVGHNRLRQLVSKTGKGYLLLADFGQGLLVAVSDSAATEAIVPLMKSVRRVTAA